jgi:hypothetical protein
VADGDRAALQKLADDRLRAFAAEAAHEPSRAVPANAAKVRISVFVEVAEPPQLDVVVDERPGLGRRPSVRPAASAEPAGTGPSALAREVEVLLTQQTGQEPVWIGAARAFVVDTSAEQLLALIESPLVRRISRNRRVG